MFADATYEGDLSRSRRCRIAAGARRAMEFNEPARGGRGFTNIGKGPRADRRGRGTAETSALTPRTGAALTRRSPSPPNRAVQAYNYRFCVTKDPANRILPAAPPPGYSREEYVHYERKGIATIRGRI